ncbi:hypothetical protein ACC703_38395, partial [Rhizobium ruizarguesonis]
LEVEASVEVAFNDEVLSGRRTEEMRKGQCLDLELLDNKSPDLWPIVTGSETAKAGDDIALTHLPPGETKETGKACWSDQPTQERIAIDYFVLSP